MYVHTISYEMAFMCGIHLYPASLTLFFAVTSAPIWNSVSMWRFLAALYRAVNPPYNNKMTGQRDRSPRRLDTQCTQRSR